MEIREVVTYLEMTSAADLVPGRPPGEVVEVRRAEVACPELNRFFYTAVGGDWHWTDRLAWTYAQWLAAVTRPGHETWVAYVRGTPAGYFELDGEGKGGAVELEYFGLLPQFAGRGVGGHLLTVAVRRAWEKQAGRVWLHTSSLDHPAAIGNYVARGFRVVRAEEGVKEMAGPPPGAWPGAGR